jgi:hypothetical protein
MAGMLVGGQAFAQVKNEQGSIDITAKIITAIHFMDSFIQQSQRH